MSTPVARSFLTDPDPLGQPSSSSPSPLVSPSPARPSTSSPMSFKRRTASKPGVGAKASSMLGGLLSRSNDDERDMLPPSAAPPPPRDSRLGLPTRIPPDLRRLSESGYSQVIASDEEDDDDLAGEDTTQSTLGTLAGQAWKRRMTGPVSQGGGNRVSFSDTLGKLRRTVSGSFSSQSPGGGGSGEGEAEPVPVTPLPKIPIIVLSIAMFGEFLSSSVSSPFLFFMIESFGVGSGPNGGGESAVSLWTGIVSAVFFLSQFLTAMLWVSVAEKHGRRAVLCTSLIGNGLTVIAFGTSKNLPTAITTRLAMGLFNGAVGVARSAVQDVTDESNRSAAYTILGLVWGLGGIVGSVLGGTLEHPVAKFPSYFGDSDLFARNPYLLPCMVAGSVTLSGGFLSLFLNREGGQRTGGIHLPTEKDVEVAASTLSKVRDWLVGALSALYARVMRRPAVQLGSPDIGNVSLHPSHATIPPLPSPAPSPSLADAATERNPLSGQRRSSRQYGSAYGYSRQPSQAGTPADREGLRYPSIRRRGPRTFSMATSMRYDPENDIEHSFAERLLLAARNQVFSVSDVFIAKATADDQFSVFEAEGSIVERDDDEESRIEGTDLDGANSEYDVGFGSAPPSMEDLRGEAARQDAQRNKDDEGLQPRPTSPTSLRPPTMYSPSRERVVSWVPSSFARHRRGSAASTRPFSIYSNTGLAPETIASSANQLSSAVAMRPDESGFSPMAAIPETRPASIIEHPEGVAEDVTPAGLVWQLPLAMILQYFCVGLHGTACDQVFGSFVVTKVANGGLGLSAQHFSILVAIMFFFQLIWNFKFYPSIGPPNGALSHLSMFRLGLLLYIPVYLLFPELRGLIIVEGEDALVMTGMVVLSAIRYLANACAYTSVMVLINVMTPIELVPLANGLAQSCISLARFIGPILGGAVFAASISDGPNAHPWPLNYSAGFNMIAGICLVGFLLSWRIR
ncbi:hypothetical protein JCM10207_001120 [Rhodosporidiobolus poonsookiae]